MQNKIVLEPTSNTHELEAKQGEIKSTYLDDSTIKLNLKSSAIATHGDHGTLVTESNTVVKYNQQELNPVTRKMENAYD